MNVHETTIVILKKIADKYNLTKLGAVLEDDKAKLFEKDIYICLKNIVEAVESNENTLELLKDSKNVYGAPVFLINRDELEYLIKSEPDFDKAIEKLGKFSFCFKLSPYHVINTYLAIVESQIVGLDLEELYNKGVEHIEESIKLAVKDNTNWNSESLVNKKPRLVMPIGAAGCGKSTFYRELSGVINISCDNIRYLLFKEYGPCFSSWESCLSWWVVNHLTDNYIEKGYSVFYNGVNTDLEYRSPITMEDPDPVFAGMPYDIKLVYFEPAVKLNDEELMELKNINMWATPIDKLDLSGVSANVSSIIDMIRKNYERTLSRTRDISEGKVGQNPFDVLYSVPAPVVKLFVEQSFNQPKGDNVTVVERKELPDDIERAAFYRKCAVDVVL